MPVWIAGTDANRRTAESVWIGPHVEFTEPGGLTTFRINPNGTPEDWFAGVLGDVASRVPTASPRLRQTVLQLVAK